MRGEFGTKFLQLRSQRLQYDSLQLDICEVTVLYTDVLIYKQVYVFSKCCFVIRCFVGAFVAEANMSTDLIAGRFFGNDAVRTSLHRSAGEEHETV